MVPCIIAATQIILFLTVFRQEPIGYCIANEKENEAKDFMKRIYKTPKEATDEKITQMIDAQY